MSPDAGPENTATLVVRDDMLLGPLLSRVVGMLAARAQCPVDRLDDAMLLTDAVAAHAPVHSTDGSVCVRVDTADGGITLHVGPLVSGGASAILNDAALPGVGNIFERVADSVTPEPAGEAGETLILKLDFGRR